MKNTEDLKEFCRELMRYVGSGYHFGKIVYIPSSKGVKINELQKKVSDYFKTNLTRGKRQWNKLNNRANFAAVSFKYLIVILKTSGTEAITKPNEFREIKTLDIVLSDFLGLKIFKDERNTFTFRLSKDTYQKFKGDYQQAFKEGSGKKFHTLQKMWSNLPSYVGIGKQRKELNNYLRELSKIYKRTWDIKFWNYGR